MLKHCPDKLGGRDALVAGQFGKGAEFSSFQHPFTTRGAVQYFDQSGVGPLLGRQVCRRPDFIAFAALCDVER
jgi:hypothetical protein